MGIGDELKTMLSRIEEIKDNIQLFLDTGNPEMIKLIIMDLKDSKKLFNDKITIIKNQVKLL